MSWRSRDEAVILVGMAERSDKRVVEATIAGWITTDLSGAELGEKVIEAIDRFAFQHIEDTAAAEDLFAFVQSQDERKHLASVYRGTRWQQKIGLMFARPTDHDAHNAQVRAQLVGYGAIAEAALRIMLQQNGKDAPPNDFDGIITKARAAGILSRRQQNRPISCGSTATASTSFWTQVPSRWSLSATPSELLRHSSS